MYSLLKISSLMTMVLFPLATTGHAVEVKVDYDPAVDFSTYRTLGWGEGTPVEDPELERRIHAAIERELIPLGIREVRSDPDLQIVTHAAMDGMKTVDVTQFAYWLGYQGWKRPLAVAAEGFELPVGMLIVDMLDTSDYRLVWRGLAIGNVGKTSERRGEKLDRTMANLFKGFPPSYRPQDP